MSLNFLEQNSPHIQNLRQQKPAPPSSAAHRAAGLINFLGHLGRLQSSIEYVSRSRSLPPVTAVSRRSNVQHLLLVN